MTEECRYLIHWCELKMIMTCSVCVFVCSVTLDLTSSPIVLKVFVIIIISVIFIRNFILPGIRYIEISTVQYNKMKKNLGFSVTRRNSAPYPSYSFVRACTVQYSHVDFTSLEVINCSLASSLALHRIHNYFKRTISEAAFQHLHISYAHLTFPTKKLRTIEDSVDSRTWKSIWR